RASTSTKDITSSMKTSIQKPHIRVAAIGVLLVAVSVSLVYREALAQVNFSGTVSVSGGVSVLGSLSKGSGTFVIDHPLDPENKLLYHSFVESPDVKNIYDGIVTLDENGEATVELP